MYFPTFFEEDLLNRKIQLATLSSLSKTLENRERMKGLFLTDFFLSAKLLGLLKYMEGCFFKSHKKLILSSVT